MSAHTPGPWAVNEKFRKPIVGYDVGDGGDLLPIVDAVHGYNMKQARANARLIAAAPDLLEAAQSYIADRAEAGCTADSAAVKRLRAAIAKATS